MSLNCATTLPKTGRAPQISPAEIKRCRKSAHAFIGAGRWRVSPSSRSISQSRMGSQMPEPSIGLLPNHRQSELRPRCLKEKRRRKAYFPGFGSALSYLLTRAVRHRAIWIYGAPEEDEAGGVFPQYSPRRHFFERMAFYLGALIRQVGHQSREQHHRQMHLWVRFATQFAQIGQGRASGATGRLANNRHGGQPVSRHRLSFLGEVRRGESGRDPCCPFPGPGRP